MPCCGRMDAMGDNDNEREVWVSGVGLVRASDLPTETSDSDKD